MANFTSLISSNDIVLVDFYAEWCGPCKTMAPILKEVKNQMGDKVKIVKIDVDKNAALAQKLSVRGVPTLVVYKNGQSIWRQSGVVTASDLVSVLQSA